MTAETTSQAPPQAAKPPVVRRLARILAIVVLSLLILIAAVFIFTQTAWFRSIIANELISTVEQETNGTLEIGDIGGDLFSGFVLRDVRLRLKNDTATIFEAPVMLAKYSLYDLLTSDRLSASDIVLTQPKITFFREKGDSLWNFQKLIKPREGPVDTAKFRGIIEIGNLRIHSGSLAVRDLFYGRPVVKEPSGAIDWGYMNVENLDVDLRASIYGATFQVIDLQNLSFYERRSGFSLRRLSGYMSRTDNTVKIEGLNLVTNETALKVTARVDSLVVLSGKPFEEMENAKVELHLDATALSAKELFAFIPDLKFLGDVPALKLDASGTFNDLQIQTGELNLRRYGAISFDGTIGNLHEPEKMRLDINLEGKHLSQSTLNSFVPGLHITGFERYGTVEIDHLEYHGSTTSFATRFDISSGAGDAAGIATLDLSGSLPRYEAHITTSDLNLAAIANTDELDSRLNLKIDARGSGFDIKTMNSDFVISAYRDSRMSTYSIASFAAHGNIRDGVFTGRDIIISMGGDRLLMAEYATIDFVGKEKRFDVALSTKDFPIAEFIPELPKPMRVTATANLEGSLMSLIGLSGSLQSEVRGLKFHGSPLAPVRIDAVFERDSLGIRTDRIESSIADLTLKGNYRLNTLAALIPHRIQAVAAALDSSIAPPTPEPYYDDTARMDLRINLKDVRPLAFLWEDITFLSQVKLSASLVRLPGGRIDANLTGTVPALILQNRSDSLGSMDLRIFDTTHVNLEVINFTNDPRTLLDSLRTTFAIQTDSSLRFMGMSYERPKVSVEYGERDFSFDIGTGIGNDIHVYLRGGGGLALTTFEIALDSLAMQVNDALWQSEQTTHLRFDPNGSIALDTLRLYRPELGHDPERKLAQRIEVGGMLRNDTIEYAFIHAPQLKLNELPSYFSDTSAPAFARELRGRVSNLDVDVSGPLSKPVISATLLLRNFTYQDIFLDSCLASFQYKDFNLAGQLRLHVDSAKYAIESLRSGRGALTIAGNNGIDISIDSLPILISFGDYPERTRDQAQVEHRRVALRASGDDFPIDLLTPILPFVSDLSGFADITLDARGTRDQLVLTGQAVIDNGALTLATTNVPYTFNGTIEFHRDRLDLNDFSIRNLPSDDPSGIGSLSGKVDLDGLSIRNVDLTLRTDRLTVLTDDSRATLKTIYGPLAIKSGARPIHFFGALDAPHLAGDIIIPQGYLTMPPAEGGQQALDKGIIYRVIDLRETLLEDTTHVDTLSVDFLPTLYDKLDRFFALEQPSSIDTTIHVEDVAAPAGSEMDFVDALRYDVTLNIPGDTWLNIYFDRFGFVGDQLSAELRSEGPIRIFRDRPGPENLVFTGTLAVTDRSSYKFFKEFSPVTGTIRFFNELTNPRLDITAEYTGAHADRSNEIYKVVITISGTLDAPTIDLLLYKKNDLTGRFDQIQKSEDELKADVLLFLAMGKFRSDGPSGKEFSSSLETVPSSFTNALISTALGSTALRNYIRTVSIEGGFTDSSRIKLVGGYKDVTFTLGSGKFKSFWSGDYLVEIPLSTVVTFDNARNHLLQLEAHFQDLSTETYLGQQQKYVARYLFRIPLW